MGETYPFTVDVESSRYCDLFRTNFDGLSDWHS